MKSLTQLFKSIYNQSYPIFALQRFFIWKIIRIFKIEIYSYKIWGNRKINLHFDNQQSAWIMYNYWVDWEEFNLIKDILKEDDIVFDIGANIGFYTIWMSKFIGNAGRIHSFEPDNKSFERLNKNIVLNNIQSYTVSNRLAIADTCKQLKFTEGRDGENHIVYEPEDNYQIITSTTIDNYIADYKIEKIKYIKIDIEGFEYQALLGAMDTLHQKKVDIIQLEINSQISNSGISIAQLLTLIKRFDYTLCSYDVPSRALRQIDYTGTRENYFMVNNNLFNN